MAQVQIAHPGKRNVYFSTKDEKGKAKFVKYEMADVDAVDAVTRFPDQYSFDPPKDESKIDDQVPKNPLVAGETTTADMAALERDVAHADKEVEDAQAALDAAKLKGDPKALGKAQSDLDTAKELSAEARSKLDAAKNG